MLGLLIEQARKAADLSQEALGETVGVSQQSVQAWENGATKPSAERWPTLEDLFQWPRGHIARVLAGEANPLDEVSPDLRSKLGLDEFTFEEQIRILEHMRGYMDAIKERRS